VSDPEAVWCGLLWYSTNLSALLACCDLCVGKEKLLVCVCACGQNTRERERTGCIYGKTLYLDKRFTDFDLWI